MGLNILGTGQYLPKTVLTNQELAQRVDTSDEWIRQRVGIKSRHIADQHESAAVMAYRAALEAIAVSGVQLNDIDLIVVATATSDYIMPALACELQALLDMSNPIPAFDVNAACGGFVYGLNIVEQYYKAGTVKNVLLVAVERMSRVMDWSDRSTCVLFGDGASAVVLGDGPGQGLISSHIHSAGQYRDHLFVENNLPQDPYNGILQEPKLAMRGQAVFKSAVSMLAAIVEELLEANQLNKEDIDWLVPHQANARILQATAKKFGLPLERVIMTLEHHGNTSAASVPLALDTAIKDGRIKRGQLLVLEAFGAGFVWGSALIRY